MRRKFVKITTSLMLLAFTVPALIGPAASAPEFDYLGATELPGFKHIPLPGVEQSFYRTRCETLPLGASFFFPDPRSDLWLADQIVELFAGECE